jgi:exopolysaccharide biosynthesis protein
VIALPAQLAPPAPFPLVVAQANALVAVAPGVTASEIRMRTSAGPLVVHIVSIDPATPSIRYGVVLAHDRLVSAGETVSSMAIRTGAIAGVNADYFDIGNTNQPLNLVVQNGTLVRSPSKRIVLVAGADRRVRFTNATMTGTASFAGTNVPLTGVNIWPPEGGTSLMTPAYGPIQPRSGVSTVPIDAQRSLAFGPAALAVATPPPAGTPIAVSTTLNPPLDTIDQAVGGGPLLVANGAAVADPNEPAPEEHNIRFPLSGAATLADGTLILAAVDGRTSDLSIGLTRPEFAALFLGLGATDAMAFDSGGSATLVARTAGDARPVVLNAPSDGMERPVANGFFVYSIAPRGEGLQLVARPLTPLALPGGSIALRGAIVDSSGNLQRPVSLPPIVAAQQLGPHSAMVQQGSFTTTISYTTVDRVASLHLAPDRPNVDPGQSIAFHATALDGLGRPVAVDRIQWTGAQPGEIGSATAVAGRSDAVVAVSAGGVRSSTIVRVGRHTVALDLFGSAAASRWSFASAPRGMPGAVNVAGDGTLALTYDLTSSRAAYAIGPASLPGEPLAFEIDVFGDESGAGLRAAFINTFGERRALTLASRIDWSGWKHVRILLPPDLNPPITLATLYVARLGEAPAKTGGTIRFRNATVTLPGT